MTSDPCGTYFFHIPKTAGMNVWKAIDSAYDPESICPYWLWDQLIDVPQTELAKYDVFRGHLYGFLEEYLGRELRKFTLLRDPLERTVSCYYFIRQLPEHPNHKHAQALSLREFCTHEATRYLVENYQAGYLASFVFTQDPIEVAKRFTLADKRNHLFQAALEPSPQVEPDVLLSAAQQGLRRFCAVGAVEDLEGSLRIVSEALGRTLSAPKQRQNVTPKRVAIDELDEATLEVIHRITAVDRILYAQVAAAVEAESFDLQGACKMYGHG